MIQIDQQIKVICPTAALGIIQYKTNVQKSSPEELAYFDEIIQSKSNIDILTIPAIRDTRENYKRLGKSPSKYRNAAEAMLRRVVKKKGLYHINNVVDINNMVSISTGYSIGSYDIEQLKGNIIFKRAEDGTKYEGIGKDVVNIEHLPTLYDEIGPFGNPTSDSRRAMVTEGNHSILTVIYSFTPAGLPDAMMEWKELLEKYTNANNIQMGVVK